MVHTRFWSFQLFFCCLPSFAFMMVVTNYEAQLQKVHTLEPDPEEPLALSNQATLESVNANNSNTTTHTSDYTTVQNQPYTRLRQKKEKLEYKMKEKQVTRYNRPLS